MNALKKALPFAFAFIAVALRGPTSHASDHIDGIKTALDNAADLTDLFTFTSPQDSSKLVMIMNVHGVASSGSRFSNAVDYKFRVRPVDANTLAPNQDDSTEQSIVCSFTGGGILDASQQATCVFNFGDSSPSVTFDTRNSNYGAGGDGTAEGIHVFAGVRSDPWFLDLGKTLEMNHGLPTIGPGINGLYGQNVLTIAIEVDKSRFNGPLLAITAQTVRR